MKTLKYLSVAFMLMIATAVNAQTETGYYAPMVSATNSGVLDTVPGNGARSQVLRVNGWWDNISILATVTEISGTTAGTVKLWGSINGTNYAQIDTNYFSPADQGTAQSYVWKITKSRYTYYKVIYTGTGTMSAKLSTGLLKRSKIASNSGTLRHLASVSNGTVIDTVGNSATKSQLLRLAGFQDAVTVVTTVTEIAGTTAGTVKLYGSLDGTNYVLAKADYFSPADVTGAQSYKWEFDESPFTYWKVIYVGGGSNNAKLSTDLLSRQK